MKSALVLGKGRIIVRVQEIKLSNSKQNKINPKNGKEKINR